MNTMLATTGLRGGGVRFFDGRGRPVGASASREKARSVRPAGFWNENDISVQKWLLLLLAVGVVLGIAYGFSCLVDLVQGWAAMERGVSTLI